MKNASWRLGWAAFTLATVATPVAAQGTVRPQLAPPFVADQLIIALAEDLTGPAAGRTLAELYAAAGVTEIAVFPTFVPGDHLALVRLQEGMTLGRAFQALQTFDFGPAARWSLRHVGPVYTYCAIPEGCGVLEVSHVFNFSVRSDVRTGDGVTIGGMVVPGEFPRLVVFKVRGPSLEQFDVRGTLVNPRLRLYRQNEPILVNDDWGSLAEWEKALAETVCPPPENAREAMIVTLLDPGVYTAVVGGAEAGSGIALLEMYLVDAFRVQ